MKNIKLKILLILLILVPFPFSCKDDCSALLDLYVEPYFKMLDIDFEYVDSYYINKQTNKPMFERISQDFENTVYTCENMALYFKAPDTALLFHSQNIFKTNGFGFAQEAIACEKKRPGYAGTKELVEKIIISTVYDFDDMHKSGTDISDIVEIFAYTTGGENKDSEDSKEPLTEYNDNSPYEAPKRFYLLIKTPARLSEIQQFIVHYYMMPQSEGEAAVYYSAQTPKFKVKVDYRNN